MKWVTGWSVTCLIAAGSLSASAGGASTTTTPADVTTKLDWTKPEITTYPASPALWSRYPSAGSCGGRACSGSGKKCSGRSVRECCINFSLYECYAAESAQAERERRGVTKEERDTRSPVFLE